MKKICLMLILSMPLLSAAQGIDSLKISVPPKDKAYQERLQKFLKAREEQEKIEAQRKQRLAEQDFDETQMQQVLDKISARLEIELKNTKAGERVLSFYQTDTFKNSGGKAFALSARQDGKKEIAYWDSDEEKIIAPDRFFAEYIKSSGLSINDLLENENAVIKITRCIAPVFVHESEHQRAYFMLKEKNLHAVYTLEEELFAYGWGEFFRTEKEEQQPGYTDGCEQKYFKITSLERLYSAFAPQYPNLADAFNKDNISRLIEIRQRAGKHPFYKMMADKRPPLPDFFLKDVLTFGTPKHYLRWDNLPDSELKKAVNGSSRQFNEYRKINDERLQELQNAYSVKYGK